MISFVSMMCKKININRKQKFYGLFLFLLGGFYNAQYQIKLNFNEPYIGEVYLYTYSGNKKILNQRLEVNKKNILEIGVKQPYKGMQSLYFADLQYSLPLVSENKNIEAQVLISGNKVVEHRFQDEANQSMEMYLKNKDKVQYVLPVLNQIKGIYNPKDDFYQDLLKEIQKIQETDEKSIHVKGDFTKFYFEVQKKFLQEDKVLTQQEIIKFLKNSNEYLETSLLLRPILFKYLNLKESADTPKSVSMLLDEVNLETSRGQHILSEFIDIFDTYSMTDLKEKYLNEAKNLKCTIFDRLKNTIVSNDKVNIGAVFANTPLQNSVNTKVKNLYDIKSNQKIIVFWSSGCSHCDRELPEFIPYLEALKKKNISIIGFSLDSDKAKYLEKAQIYSWVSASELKGWHSSYVEKYNLQATPSYFVLDSKNKIIAKPNNAVEVIEFLKIK